MVCHDLRAPLTGLRGFLELLGGLSPDGKQREYLNTALVCLDDLQDTLEGLLECLREDSGQLPLRDEPCDIGGLMRDKDDAALLFEVCDSGRGISRSQLSRVFDAFYQAGSAGTGLGLAIVRKLAFAMGGEVEIRSVHGQGTLILVELPARRA